MLKLFDAFNQFNGIDCIKEQTIKMSIRLFQCFLNRTIGWIECTLIDSHLTLFHNILFCFVFCLFVSFIFLFEYSIGSIRSRV